MSHQPIGNHGLKNLLMWSDFTLGSRLSDGRLASFLSGGYNLHRFALHLVTFLSFIKQTFCLLSVSTSCSHKHLCPLPTGVYLCQP